MEITEVRIKLMERSEDRLRAFCSITIDDCFVIRDLKIIEGNNGPFVAMPSRKLTANCHKCRSKNHFRAKFCNNCGARQRREEVEIDHDGRAKLYADIAHPVNAECREMIQDKVIEEFENEIQRSAQPGYSSRYDDDYISEPPSKTSKPDPSEQETTVDRVDPPESSKPSRPNFRIDRESKPNSEPDSLGSRPDRLGESGSGPSGPTQGSNFDAFGKGIFE